MFRNFFKRQVQVGGPGSVNIQAMGNGSIAAGGNVTGVTTGVKDPRFEAWPKTLQISKVLGNVTVTEKIDGTNACLVFDADGNMFAQSRNRVITPASDNQGFARWAYRYQEELFHILGEGRHFGEWWGKGIGRKYGMEHNVFSLFNVGRFYKTGPDGLDSMSTRAQGTSIFDQVSAVPHLFTGEYGSDAMKAAVTDLQDNNSKAAAQHGIDFADPEGVCFYFREFDKVAKLVFAHPGKHKWEVR